MNEQDDLPIGRQHRRFGPYKLTARECEVLDQLMMGKTNAEIGSTLFICEKAVKFHMTNIMRKYGVTNRTSLIVKETQRRIEKGNS